jgi:prephenate dehydrogenase
VIKKLAIIGLGLIGGSLARALRQASQVEHIVGCGRSLANLQRGLELGVVDSYTLKVAEAVQDADMVFVAVPLGAMRGVFQQMAGHLSNTAIVTDGGSAKASVIADFQAACPGHIAQFVPGHPIAGTENNGVEASFAELYQNRRVILTPSSNNPVEVVQRVTQMWEACGAQVLNMDVQHHDEVLAATSHLPHMLAFSLVDVLARMDGHDEIFQYAAGGFRDFTRIASSNPVMWRDICVANKTALSDMLKHYSQELNALAKSVESGDAEALLAVFERAKAARDAYVAD